MTWVNNRCYTADTCVGDPACESFIRSAACQAQGSLEEKMSPETDQISDGFHTFGELYAHRRALTAALVATGKFPAWRSRAHHPDDSPCFPGYFIVGIELPTGTITYHYPDADWDDFHWGTDDLDHAPKWDGAAADDSVTRLLEWARTP